VAKGAAVEDVLLQREERLHGCVVAGRAHGSFHVPGRGSAIPVVDVVEDQLEFRPGQRGAHRLRVIAVGHDVAHLAAQVMLGAAMHHGDVMAGFEQLRHQRLADESCSSDDEAIHGRAFMREHSWDNPDCKRG
jgi:hypothetical protein